MSHASFASVGHVMAGPAFDASKTAWWACGGILMLTAGVAAFIGACVALAVTEGNGNGFKVGVPMLLVNGGLGLYWVLTAWANGPTGSAIQWTLLGCIPAMLLLLLLVWWVRARRHSRRQSALTQPHLC